MPTYQYACTECGHRFEAVQSFTDDSLTTCPVCSGQLRKVYGSVGVVFKGSGFYRTDSREKASAGANGSGDKSAEKTAGKAEKSGEKSGGDKAGGEKSTGEKKPAAAKAAPAASSSGGSSGGSSSSGSKAAAG